MAAAAAPQCEVFVGGGSESRLDFGKCIVTELLADGALLKDDGCPATGSFVDVQISSIASPNSRPRIRVSHLPLGEPESERCWSFGPLSLGHARECPCDVWNAAEEGPLGKEIRAAGCILVTDEEDRLLLTRRAANMRTFSGCWVFPGGRVDPGENIPEAALREVWEETGLFLLPSSLAPLCAWESCFPDSAPGAAHYLVFFFTATVDPSKNRKCEASRQYQLVLNPTETDVAVWLDLQEHENLLRPLLSHEGDNARIPMEEERIRRAPVATKGAIALESSLPAEEVFDLFSEESERGMGRGHLFALQMYLQQNRRREARQTGTE